MNKLLFSTLLFSLLFSAPSVQAAALHPTSLCCEYRINPQGIDAARPRLTWQVAPKSHWDWLFGSDARGERQTAYRILVASSAEQLAKNSGDLWDSGKISSDDTVNIAYAGRPLVSREQCFWKVCTWDQNGKAKWSEPTEWSMGLLKPSDWSANYISFRDTTPLWTNPAELFLPPAHQYRKEFSAAKKIKRATIYATALGIYDLYLNGQRVGDAVFAPGWTGTASATLA